MKSKFPWGYGALLSAVILALLIGPIVFAAPSRTPLPWIIPERMTVDGVSEFLGVTTSSAGVKQTPTDTEPAAEEGMTYWDDSENAMKHYNGSSWVALTASTTGTGDNTLDQAYDQNGVGAGRAIIADSGAVTITVTDGSSNIGLTVTQNDSSNNPAALTIANAGTGADISGQAVWQVLPTGAATFLDVTLENTGTIKNDTNNEIEFGDNGEDVSLVFTSNTVTWATDSTVATMGFGDVDALIGIGSIAFDQVASSISLAANGSGDDLTVAVTGAQDSSLILSSAGTGSDALQITASAGSIVITAAASKNISLTAGSSADVIIPANVGLTFGTGEKIEGDSTDLTLTSGALIELTATSDVVIPTSVGLTFGAGEKIEGDDTNLTLTSGALIKLTAASDVAIPANIGLTFGTGEKIEGDNTDLTVTSGGAIELTAVTDIVIPANVGMTFGSGEKIEGTDTDITITSGALINLTATTDVVIPTSVGITFGSGEKIEGNDTDLTVTSGGAINLTGTTDIVIPTSVGITFGTGEKIEGNDTDLTVTSGGAINLTAVTDIVIPTSVGITFGSGEKIEGDDSDLTLTSGSDITLAATAAINVNGDIERAAGKTEKLNGDYQTEYQSVTFDIEEVAMDNDDGTGIKVESINLAFDAYIVSALVIISQGCADASDTVELIINNTDDITSATTTLVSAQDSAAAGLLAYTPASSTTVEIGIVSSTDQYVVAVYKDVGDDGSTGANLKGTLVVEYLRY